MCSTIKLAHFTSRFALVLRHTLRDTDSVILEPTTAERDRLDNLYREDVRYSEEEAKVLKEEPYGLINKMEIYRLLHAADEPPQARNPPVSKPRKLQRPATGESDAVVDSPGPSPNDARHDPLRKLKSASQRSSSVASAARVGISARSEDGGEALKGKHAERAGHFVIGAEVFYRHPKGALNPEGLGIQCIIKKVWQDRTQYEELLLSSPCRSQEPLTLAS